LKVKDGNEGAITDHSESSAHPTFTIELLFSNILASFLIFRMEPHGTYLISVGMFL
jgi:hypothetical protein